MVEYPASRREPGVDSYHGTSVADPFRWLEDMDSEETSAWVDAQNEVTFSYLAGIPGRDGIRSRFEQLWNFPRESAPVRRGEWYFYSRNDGLQAQPTLMKRPVAGGEASTLVDPNLLSDDGTIALMTQSFTADGKRLAFSLAEAGSDWQQGRIMDTETRHIHEDGLRDIKFTSFAWLPDGGAFYYSRYPKQGAYPDSPPSTNQKVYLHRVGTDQTEDELIYEREDQPDFGFDPLITDDAELLLLHVWQGTDTRNRLYYRRLTSNGEFIRLLDDFDAKYQVVGHNRGWLYLLTDRDAPRGRVVAIDLDRPEPSNWREIVAETADTLEFATMVSGHIVTGHLRDANHVLGVYDIDGAMVRILDLPGVGTVTQLSGKTTHDEMFIGFESFVHPPTILRYDFAAETLETISQPETTVDADRFTTSQIWAESTDGTAIPVFVTHLRDLVLDGSAPTVLYGYGGFDISMTPLYAPDRLGFIEAGGVFAVANLRGGGEYGQEWHRAGMLGKKQNVFDDFIAAGEHLITAGYTSSKNLGIYGRSNGGLLVTACLLQRPDLFAAVVGMVPVTDMLRYHLFTAGRYWTPEYGNAEKNYLHFEFLYEYSPVHNVKPGVYPPTMITTGDTDDRVVPLHSYKFVAELQSAVGDSGPALLRVDRRAGHGLGKPTDKLIEEAADIYSFFLHHLK